MRNDDVCLELYVSFDDRDALLYLAEERGMSVSELLEELVTEFITNNA